MEDEKEFTYYAFISYKREEEQWAKWLQRKLEHYRFPTTLNGYDNLPKQIYPIFRDVTDLSPAQLEPEIDKALSESEWLIVMCSPKSAQSPWVCKEAQTFIDIGRADHIIPFVIDGTPFSDDIATECYPEALRNLTGKQELLAANINEMGRDAAAIKVVARMFNLRFDTLWQRYVRERHKRRNWIIVGATTFIIFLLGVIGFILNQNENLRRSNSRAAANAAEKLIEEGDIYTARRVAAAALEKVYTPEAEMALWHAYENTILKGHTNRVVSVDISPDGEKLLSASLDGTLRLWEIATGRCLYTIRSFEEGFYFLSVSFSCDGKKFVYAAANLDAWQSTISIWDVKTCQKITTLFLDDNYYKAVFKPDGKKVLALSVSNSLLQIDASTGTRLGAKKIKMPTSYDIGIGSCALSNDGRKFVCISLDNTIDVWDLSSGECLNVIRQYDSITYISFSLDQKSIVSASAEGMLRIWDATTGLCLDSIKTPIKGLCNTDRRFGLIVSETNDHSIQIHNMAEKQQPWNLHKKINIHSQNVCFSPDGKKCIVMSKNNELQIWDIEKFKCIHTIKHSDSITYSSFSSDGKMVISASVNNNLRIWDASSGKKIKTIPYIDRIKSVGIGSDGFVIVLQSFGLMKIWNETEGQWKTLDEWGQSVEFSPDGKKFVLVGSYNRLKLIDPFKLFQTLEGHSGKINFVSYSLDGEKIVSASDDKTLRIWDAETGYCLNVLRGHSGGVKTASFSPDGMRIVSTSDDKTIRIWDVSTGQCFFIFNEDGLSFRSAVFSPKGNIITSLSDGTIRVYELPDINDLIQKTNKQFKDYPLTHKERKLYYLE